MEMYERRSRRSRARSRAESGCRHPADTVMGPECGTTKVSVRERGGYGAHKSMRLSFLQATWPTLPLRLANSVRSFWFSYGFARFGSHFAQQSRGQLFLSCAELVYETDTRGTSGVSKLNYPSEKYVFLSHEE
ncbi:hypothetical protein EVAR_18304_1 [Eumeta japonica]|uniref:Uncharacterized protein n=1 Tax=Eumeta variegata TaxID=151549 RepID=A0A4C1V914_EUMVA|nr:hypothetical protein EVAR_18304_1 [Eumeta japonica]